MSKLVGVTLLVVMPDSQQNQQPAADRAANFSADNHASLTHTLNYGTHNSNAADARADILDNLRYRHIGSLPGSTVYYLNNTLRKFLADRNPIWNTNQVCIFELDAGTLVSVIE